MKRALSVLAAIVFVAGVASAELSPYTFGMKVVMPEGQSGKFDVVAPASSSTKVFRVVSGGVEKFSITAAGAVSATIPASAITAGALGSGVIASSVAINSVTNAAIVSVAPAKISAGSLGADVIASSVAVGSVTDTAIVGMSASKLTGALPAISGAALTGVTAVALTDKTLAELALITPTGAEVFRCSDCTPIRIAIATNTVEGAFADAMGLQLN